MVFLQKNIVFKFCNDIFMMSGSVSDKVLFFLKSENKNVSVGEKWYVRPETHLFWVGSETQLF